MSRLSLTLGAFAALIGLSGVALAAIGAHGGGGGLAETGAFFLIVHAAALLGLVGAANAVAHQASRRALLISGFGLGCAVSLFSGDLAARALAGGRLFPFAAPIGGTAMMFFWVCLAAIFATSAMRRE